MQARHPHYAKLGSTRKTRQAQPPHDAARPTRPPSKTQPRTARRRSGSTPRVAAVGQATTSGGGPTTTAGWRAATTSRQNAAASRSGPDRRRTPGAPPRLAIAFLLALPFLLPFPPPLSPALFPSKKKLGAPELATAAVPAPPPPPPTPLRARCAPLRRMTSAATAPSLFAHRPAGPAAPLVRPPARHSRAQLASPGVRPLRGRTCRASACTVPRAGVRAERARVTRRKPP